MQQSMKHALQHAAKTWLALSIEILITAGCFMLFVLIGLPLEVSISLTFAMSVISVSIGMIITDKFSFAFKSVSERVSPAETDVPALRRREAKAQPPAKLFELEEEVFARIPAPRFPALGYSMPGRSMTRRTLLTILATAAVAGVAGAYKLRELYNSSPGSPTLFFSCTWHSSNPVTLTMYYSTEKQDWINNVVGDFNNRHLTACDGPITVKTIGIGSGEAMQEILNGRIQPDIWSPAGSAWLYLLNEQWKQMHGSNITSIEARDTLPLVLSPVVIAMWQPMAEELGWPKQPIGWADIARLSTNSQGWVAYGHPEWGDFKFGHTHPDYSNSGLHAIIAANYAAVPKASGLTLDDVNNKMTQDFVAKIESSIIRYGDSTDTLAYEMFNKGPSYLSAAVMYESLVVEANAGKRFPAPPYPVVAIYPEEGTFYSDHPFWVPQASWVTPAKKAAATVFRDFLLARAQQQKALQYGFRPADFNLSIGPPVDRAHGVDPSQPKTLLKVPLPDIINAIESSWYQQRRRVDVMLILDHSGSMNDPIDSVSKIGAAKQALTGFIALLGESDGLGLTVFSDTESVLTPVSPLGPKRQQVLNLINEITATGNTLLYDTIADQVASLQALPSKYIKAVIVLTDGINDKGNLSLDELIKKITLGGNNEGEGVKVYTIAYGNPADINTNALVDIARATGGEEYEGTPQSISQVYNQISLFLL